MHKQTRLRPRTKTYLYSGLFFILAFLAAVVFSSDRISLGLIPVLKTNLVEIGTARCEVGSVLRKTVNDVLWLPFDAGAAIYDSDTVITGSKSSLVARIRGDIEVEVAENSLVRLGLLDGKPLIDLRSGHVKIEAKGPKNNVIVQRGMEKEQTKAEASGRQGEKSPDREQSPKAQPSEPVTIKGKDNQEERTQEAKKGTPPTQQKTTKFPYPANGTLILFKRVGMLKIQAIDVCPSQCEIHLEFAGDARDKSFAKGESPTAEFELKAGMSGKVFWTFATEGKPNERLWFEIQPFSNETVLRGMKEKRPVEIMSF